MKKAIFGGSFDPPHIGHLEIIKQTVTSLNIDELIVVPAFLNPFKSQSYAPGHLRLQWLQTMTKDIPKVKISSYEIDQDRAVPSFETVQHFIDKSHEKLYLIIGADNLASLSKWNRFEELDRLVEWVVASRDKIKVPSEYLCLDVDHDISATELRANMQEKFLHKSIAKEVIAYYKDIS